MLIGVPKEIKPQENRIGLTPESVKTLISEGHEVVVEGGRATVCIWERVERVVGGGRCPVMVLLTNENNAAGGKISRPILPNEIKRIFLFSF